MERRDRSRLDELEDRVKALEDQVAPMQKDRDGLAAVMTFGQKCAGGLIVICAVGGFVLQVIR